jgi:hypothetical protein
MRRGEVSLVTFIKDFAMFAFLVLLIPLWIALAWASLVFIVARHLYWWTTGNTMTVSKHRGRPRLSWAERRSSWTGARLTTRPGDLTSERKPMVPVVGAALETAPVSNR